MGKQEQRKMYETYIKNAKNEYEMLTKRFGKNPTNPEVQYLLLDLKSEIEYYQNKINNL